MMQDGSANNFSALWDGQKVLSITNVTNAFGYTEYTYVVTATSSTSTLEFSAAGSPWFVDNISLAQNNGTSAPVVSSIGETPVERRPQCRQDRHLYPQPQRSGDGRRWHADAHPQRRRHRHLYRRLRHLGPDLQLHRRRRAEHLGPRRHRRQSQLRDRSRTAPATPPTSRSPA